MLDYGRIEKNGVQAKELRNGTVKLGLDYQSEAMNDTAQHGTVRALHGMAWCSLLLLSFSKPNLLVVRYTWID